MFIVDSIVQERMSASGRKTEYLVQWAEYSPEWELSYEYTRSRGEVGDRFLNVGAGEESQDSTEALAVLLLHGRQRSSRLCNVGV